jgi:putative hydrolase of the HAD superfamily
MIMASKKLKCIIFDLDDTLYDQKKFLKSAFKACAQYATRWCLDRKKFYENLLKITDTYGSGCGDIFDKALKNMNAYSKGRVKELVDIFYKHQPMIDLYSDARKLLPKLVHKYILCLITDGNPDLQTKKIKSLNIEKYFSVIVLSDVFGRKYRKPSTLPYKKVLEKIGITAEEAIFIGDNPYKDFIGAKKIGLLTVRIMRGEYRNVRLNSDFEADHKIKTLSELPKIFELYDRIKNKRKHIYG